MTIRFKTWYYESLAGPGGGPEPKATQQDKLGMNIHKKGAGAFMDYSDDEMPPKSGENPLLSYLPPHTTKSVSKMKKMMKKKMKSD